MKDPPLDPVVMVTRVDCSDRRGRRGSHSRSETVSDVTCEESSVSSKAWSQVGGQYTS